MKLAYRITSAVYAALSAFGIVILFTSFYFASGTVSIIGGADVPTAIVLTHTLLSAKGLAYLAFLLSLIGVNIANAVLLFTQKCHPKFTILVSVWLGINAMCVLLTPPQTYAVALYSLSSLFAVTAAVFAFYFVFFVASAALLLLLILQKKQPNK